MSRFAFGNVRLDGISKAPLYVLVYGFGCEDELHQPGSDLSMAHERIDTSQHQSLL